MSNLLKDIFAEFDLGHIPEPRHKNYDKPINVVEFPTIHKEDNEPLNLIWPHPEKGPWIAGGAALRWYQGLPVGESDIDIFCANAKQATDIIDEIKSYGRHYVKYQSENAVTIDYHNKESYAKKWTLQIITKRYFSSLQEVIDNFDISVCQIGTDGNSWTLGPTTARDIREKNLRMRMPLQPDALKRLTKYWTYGYRPVDGLLDAIQNNPTANWMFNAETEDYQNAF